MKRLLLLVLCLVLLSGCQEDTAGEPTASTTPEVTQPQYLPQGAVVADKGLQSYGISQNVELLAPMGQELLLVGTEDSQLHLTLISGSEPVVRCQRKLEQEAKLDAAFRVSANGIAYYSPIDNSLVILDRNLQEAARIQLPQDNQGSPVVSEDFFQIYYCTADQVRVLELQTGVSRLLKQHACQSQFPLALVAEDQLLVCQVMAEDGEQIVFIDTEDGRTLGATTACSVFLAGDEGYYMQRMDGLVEEYLCGGYNTQVQAFALPREGRSFSYVPGSHTMVVGQTTQDYILLDAYSLTSGKSYSWTMISGASCVHSFAARENILWFIAENDQGASLCRWDTAATAAQAGESYLTQRYTAQYPDEERLAALQARADALGQTYGVKITVLPEDVPQPEDYTLTTEYQPEALEKGLAMLETALPRFPEGFFERIVEDTGNQALTIAFARDISDDQQSLQYWLGADAYIAITLGEDMEQLFYHELCHVLDAFIFANSRDLDVWNKLNPEGFEYDYSYDAYMSHGTEYLEGKGQAFVDNFSRTYPKEDRARVFEYAMMPDKEASFDSEIMQEKLYLLSFSIRDAFNWKRDERAFPWEYYLEEPLAYVKKK